MCSLCNCSGTKLCVPLLDFEPFVDCPMICRECQKLSKLQLVWVLQWGRKNVQNYADRLTRAIFPEADAITAQITGMRLIACAAVAAKMPAKQIVDLAKRQNWSTTVVLDELGLTPVVTESKILAAV